MSKKLSYFCQEKKILYTFIAIVEVLYADETGWTFKTMVHVLLVVRMRFIRKKYSNTQIVKKAPYGNRWLYIVKSLPFVID